VLVVFVIANPPTIKRHPTRARFSELWMKYTKTV